MRKLLTLTTALTLLSSFSAPALAQPGDLTASGGSFAGYSNTSGNSSISLTNLATQARNSLQNGGSLSQLATQAREALQNGGGNGAAHADISQLATLARDALQNGGGNVDISELATLALNALQNGGGNGAAHVDISELATLARSALQNDGGNVDISELATLVQKSLQNGGSLSRLATEAREALQNGHNASPNRGESPYAVPTSLLGNNALRNQAYTMNTWVTPPWNSPYDTTQNQAPAGSSQFDSRSWISQMPNSEGYSTTLGFQAPYSGGHGPLIGDSYSNIEISFDPLGRNQLPTPNAPRVASLFDGLGNNSVTQAVANNANNPARSLAFIQTAALVQAGILPLHFLITWGAGSSDLDLHLTGPLGNDRFHIYFAKYGSLTGVPGAALDNDCVSSSCAEVIRVEQLNPGGVYRASVYNYGDGAGLNLADQSGVEMMLVRGGTIQPVVGPNDTGSMVTGGDILYRGSPTTGQAGDTWTAFEVDPQSGAVNFVNQMSTSSNSGSVQ